MTAKKNMKITQKRIMEHIDENMDKWLFVGHVADRHINASKDEVQARLGKYSDGRLITRSSTFLDMTGGDDIVDGLTEDLKSRSEDILCWLNRKDKDEPLILEFFDLPKNVSGITCSISNPDITDASGYIILLCKNEQYPFYLLNTYPF